MFVYKLVDTVKMQQVSNFSEYMELISSGKSIVKFTADWCAPCKRLSPIFAKLITDGAKFLEVNIDVDESISEYESITGVPTVLFYRDGEKCEDLSIIGYNAQALQDNVAFFLSSTASSSDDDDAPPTETE